MRGITSTPRSVSIYIPNRRKSVLLLVALILFAVAVWFGWEPTQFASAKTATPTSPLPVVTMSVPGEVLIGENFQFEVKFKNNAGVGFAPYIDLYLPAWGADGNSSGIKRDGITFVDAHAQFTYPPTLTLMPTAYNSGIGGSPLCPVPYGSTHPFTGATVLSSAPSGQYQLVVLALPFGSFDTSQPEIVVKVTAHLSDFADEGTPLTIYTRGGFRYGGDEFDNHPGDPLIESAVDSCGTANGERIYHASATAAVSVICDKHFGSLTVNKVITTAPPPPSLTPPASALFTVTVSCLPSGINQTFNLSSTQLSQTVANIPTGSTCTSRVSSVWQELAVDELELFNRTLSQAEVQGIFNAGEGGKCRLGIP